MAGVFCWQCNEIGIYLIVGMKDYEFRWIEWNADHIGEHGVLPEEAEYVVRHAKPPWPRREGDEKYRVRGQTAYGEWLQVVYSFEPDKTIFVLHARPLTDHEKRQVRRGFR